MGEKYSGELYALIHVVDSVLGLINYHIVEISSL